MTINNFLTRFFNHERIQRGDIDDHGGDGKLREHGAEAFPVQRHRADKDLLAGREEAGRHAARPAGEISGAGREGEVLRGGRARSAVGGGRHARGRLHLPRGGAEAGAVVRVLPDAGGEDQRGGDGQRPARRDGRGRETRGLPVN